jgi:hypothetical protein
MQICIETFRYQYRQYNYLSTTRPSAPIALLIRRETPNWGQCARAGPAGPVRNRPDNQGKVRIDPVHGSLHQGPAASNIAASGGVVADVVSDSARGFARQRTGRRQNPTDASEPQHKLRC